MAIEPPPFPSASGRLRGFDIARLPHDFGDWRQEAAACRRDAALFDFSCLLTIGLQGPGVVSLLEAHTARALGDMAAGAIRYGLTADRAGRLRSDLTLWRTGPDSFLVMTGRPGDLEALQALAGDRIEDRSEQVYVLAVQGPSTAGRLMIDTALPAKFRFVRTRLCGETCLVGRIGYTGRDGVEILCPGAAAARLWGELARLARPAGLRAVDQLRIEAGLPLFAQDFAPGVSAAEAGLAAYRTDLKGQAAEITRVRAFARAAKAAPWAGFEPASARPARGAFAITSAAPWVDDETALVMGYLRNEDLRCGHVSDPAGRFGDFRLIETRGLVGPGRAPQTLS